MELVQNTWKNTAKINNSRETEPIKNPGKSWKNVVKTTYPIVQFRLRIGVSRH